jgi:hypothetical protein
MHLARRRVVTCVDADWRLCIAKMGTGPIVILACAEKLRTQCFKLPEK